LETTRKDILVKGRFNAWDAKDWAFLSLAILLPVSGLFFLYHPDFREIAIYPLLGAIPFVLIVLLRVLFWGRFHITRNEIVWKIIVGPLRSVSFDQVGFSGFELKNEEPVWVVTDKNGKKIRRFKECKPVQAAGAAILYFRYMDLLPEMVFNLWEPLSKGKRTYEGAKRTTFYNGRSIQTDTGAIVLYENKLMFIPTSVQAPAPEAYDPMLEDAGLLRSGNIYHPDGNIMTHTLMEAILEANLPMAIRDGYLQKIMADNDACLLIDPKRTGKTWDWAAGNGIQIKIERA
jgi:hypothetical protein